MRKLFSLLLLITFISCATPRTTTIKEPTTRIPSTTKGTYYIVKKGDTLWRISKKYGFSVNALMRENRISSAQDLKIGQKLSIPSLTYVKTTSTFRWPIQGEVINFYGESVDNSINRGLNIKANPNNRSVSASSDGQVVFCDNLKGWGKTIILQHGTHFYTIYANLDSAVIGEGSIARKGQAIGKVASGKNGNYILHFEIRKNYIPQDPLRYIN